MENVIDSQMWLTKSMGRGILYCSGRLH